MGLLHAVRRSVSRARRRVARAIEDGRDRRRLLARFPALADLHRTAARARQDLRPHHERYCRTVSSEDMAISLEASALLVALCEWTRPTRVLDLGSGFSSFVLRRWATGQPGVEVASADDSSEWLERTRAFLLEEGLSDAGLATWDALLAAPPAPFALVFHDLGRMPVREAALPQALSLAGRDAIVVLDDMHKKPYGPNALALARGAGWEAFSLRPWTYDRFGRWSSLLVRER